MPLAFLAPEVFAAILQGTQSVELTAERLTKRTDLPLCWEEQKALLGFDCVVEPFNLATEKDGIRQRSR
jgi:hypothetical protein